MQRHRCSFIRLMACLGLVGGAIWAADFTSPLKAQPSQEETAEVVTPSVTPVGPGEATTSLTTEMPTLAAGEGTPSVEPVITPTPSRENTASAPGEDPPDPSSLVETPPAQGAPDAVVIETPVDLEESTPSSPDMTPTDMFSPPAILGTPPIQEMPTAEVVSTAPPAENSLPLLDDVPPADQETPDISTIVEASATSEHDPLFTSSSELPFVMQVMPGAVVINEIGWAGTVADVTAQWIELYNTTTEPIWLDNWQLSTADGRLVIDLAGVIAAQGYFLLECNNDLTIRDVPADNIYVGALSSDGDTLYLRDANSTLIDTANGDGGPWPAGDRAARRSMERLSPDAPDLDENWVTHNGLVRNGEDVLGNPINGTPRQPNAAGSTVPPPSLLISEFLYAGSTPATQGDEFVELCNTQPVETTLYHLKIGDAVQPGNGEGMFVLPSGLQLAPNACLVIAKNAAQFAARFGFLPDFELVTGSAAYPDTPSVPDLPAYTAWAGRTWALDDSGDEIVLRGPDDQIVDSVAYLKGDYATAGLSPDAVHAPSPYSLQRLWPLDSDIMPADFVRAPPSPGRVTGLPEPPAVPPPTVDLAGGMHAYWGVLTYRSSYSGGNAPPVLAFAAARAADLHFLAITDDATALNPRLWSDCQQRGALTSQENAFVALCGFGYRALPQGFASVWNTSDYITPPDAPTDAVLTLDTWLKARPEALASLHRAPAAAPLSDSPYPSTLASRFHLWQVYGSALQTGAVDPLETAWIQMLAAGWQLAPLPAVGPVNRDAIDFGTQRIGVIASRLTPDELLAALRARRVFATQDGHLALTLRSGDQWMGSVLSSPEALVFEVETADVSPVPQPITLTLFDRSTPLATHSFPSSNATWSLPLVTRPGHYYWVRAVQADGDAASSAPIWVAGTAVAEMVTINEVLPAPRQVDWNGDGTPDRRDEWIELYNPDETPIGLGGWQVSDASGKRYVLPLLTTIPARDYMVLSALQTGLVLNNAADAVTLQRADGSSAEHYAYERGPGYDLSLCRLPDGIGSWQRRCQPTPGGANRALPEEEPLLTDIRGARRLPIGSWVRVRGYITVPPGVFGARVAYVQDDHSGLRLYLPKDHRLACTPGDRVEVIGRTGTYYGELQLRVRERNAVHRIREGPPSPPLPITSGQMVEPYEGMLVQLVGRVTELESRGSFWLDDGTGPARVYLDPDTGIKQLSLSVGQLVQVVGVVSQYRSTDQVRNDGYRLLPRFLGDITCMREPERPEILVPLRLPETGMR
ncbi:MAG: lamin tail domain-containing protein [Anaerolineae bacterium]